MAVRDYLTDEEINQYMYGYADDTNVENLVTQDLNGIFCIPYQFMDTADRRLEGSELGRKYADKIVARMPLLFIAPGKQSFMDDFDDEDKGAVANFLAGKVNDSVTGDINELITGSGKYYSFEYDYADYYNYVNAMCNSVAYFMGIQHEKVRIGGKDDCELGYMDWSDATSTNFKSYFSSKENVIFYCNGLTEVSENFTNNTTESSLASTINGYSDTVNEIKFLLGDGDSVINTLLSYTADVGESITSSLSGLMGELGGGLIESLCDSGVSNVLSGGKIIFPKIWQDSTYDRSYTLDFRLRSPDNDKISIFLNIIVPYIHLLALCLPREFIEKDSNGNISAFDPNGYSSPFLVKCFCKGMFNVDMGIITNMSVTKGGEQNWTDDGLPSQIDVSITIDDLYNSLAMSKYGGLDDWRGMLSNTSLLDFLANMAGLNLAQPEIARKTRYAVFLMGSAILDWPSRVWNRFDQAISNIIYGLYQKI